MQLGIGPSISKVAAVMRTFGVQFLKDNLKLFFDFKNTDLEFVGTGSTLFDGTNDQLAGTLTLSGDRSFAFWIKSTATTGNMRILHCETDSSEFINISMNAGEINMYDGTNNPETSPEYNDGIWHHVAITCATNNWTIYVDGVLVLNHTTWVNREASSDSFTIGEGTGANDFNGSLKNFAIWNRVLSASEVQNIMYKTYSDLQGTELTHLVSWYAMEESKDGDTSKMIDSKNPTTVGYDLSITNATVANFGASDVYGLDTPRKPRGVDNSKAALADQIGSGSASFDGTDDYINCGDADNLSFGDESSDSAFSWSAWIKFPSGITDSNHIITKDNSSNVEYMLFLDSDFKIKARCHDSSLEKQRGLTGTTVLSANTWHHIAWTYDGTGGDNAQSGMNIYLDGVLEAVSAEIDASSYTAMHNTSAPLYIGLTDRISDKTFEGNIAQVGLWSRVLTQEEIQEISQKQYSELTTSEKTNIVSWWALDEVFLGSNTRTDSTSATFYERGQIVEDKAGTLSTILVDNYDTLDNWEELNGNSFLTRNADGNLVITASGGSAGARLKSSFTTLETNTMYLAELAVAGGTDTSIYFRLDDEAFAGVQYGNGYMTPATNDQEFPISNTTPECLAYRFKSDSTNTGLYVTIGNIDDGKTAIIKSFKLYKIVSGNYGVLTDA